ncbi:hypothetical protein ACHAWX_005138 [Stephanocyclus meneghinianus]
MLQFYAIAVILATIIVSNIVQIQKQEPDMNAIRANISCKCGKVKIAIDSPSALRFVCYCKDCRGYYNTLNSLALKNNIPQAAKLDAFGGVDVTQIYPREIKILEGHDQLETCLIRDKSPYHRTYCKSCYTPLYSIGQGTGAALLNSALLPEKSQTNEVQYRIIGRQALQGDGSSKKPSMSWSVPIGWFFTMPKRVGNKCGVDPEPSRSIEGKQVKILEGFTEG